MKAERVMIPVGDETSDSAVATVLGDYDGERGIIFAHGAGTDVNQSMIVFLSEEMAKAGYLPLRFNFRYKEQGRNAPDRPELLCRIWEAAYQLLTLILIIEPSTSLMQGNRWAAKSPPRWLPKGDSQSSASSSSAIPCSQQARKTKCEMIVKPELWIGPGGRNR